jgi:hypothetical protein
MLIKGRLSLRFAASRLGCISGQVVGALSHCSHDQLLWVGDNLARTRHLNGVAVSTTERYKALLKRETPMYKNCCVIVYITSAGM